jgi:hypothetical protein
MRRISHPALQLAAAQDNDTMIRIAAEDSAYGLRQSYRGRAGAGIRKIQTLVDESLDSERTHWNSVQYEKTARISRKIDAVIPGRHDHLCRRGRCLKAFDGGLPPAAVVQLRDIGP